MTFDGPVPSAAAEDSDAGKRRLGRALIPTLIILVVAGLLFIVFTSFYTDLLWFRSMGKSSVFTRELTARIGLFVAFGAIMAIGLGLAMAVAYRMRPVEAARTPEQASLERYRATMEPIRRWVSVILPAVVGLLAGISASSEWRSWLLWRNQVPFPSTDPQYDTNIGFYVFSYPWLRFLLGFGIALVVLALLASLIVNYLYGGIKLQPVAGARRISGAAQAQISILLGLFCLLKAGSYWLDRFGLTLKSETLVQGFTGLKYRDVHALLPAKTIMTAIALICALLFFINVIRRSWQVAAAGLGLMVLSAAVIGGVYPALVQQFQVKPSELTKEAPYIQRNIEATRTAYGLNNVAVQEYNALATPNKAKLSTQRGTLENVRIIDPALISPTFQALQQIRTYYSFPDTLDIDRYPMAGRERGAVVAVRDVNLDGLPESQRNWANDHLVYTHGYGFVAAYDNVKQANGTPSFFEADIPAKGALKIDQPRVYFGEDSPEYSIVGGPPDSTARELDYPDDTSETAQRNNTYDGAGGVPVGSPINRLLFAVKYQEPNILLSGLINNESRILWDRDPRTIVEKVAPWLTLDADPYPVVVDGKIKWIVDAYTTSDDYPNSSRVTLEDAVSDSVNAKQQVGPVSPQATVNYIRNSVKAVVDAYTGEVNLYAWDSADPILQTWRKAFPGIVQEASEMPEALKAHVKYPEDIFKVQRLVYSRYHVADPGAFYSGQDFWIVPTDPTKRQSSLYQPPYYLSLQMPGDVRPVFSLTTTYAPVKRQTLAAFMAVNSAPGPDYGQFQVLQLPRNTTIPGPGQVQNTFESDPQVAPQLTLLRRGNAEVEQGNLLSLAVGDGMLYVEPVYVKASQDGYPLLQKVLAAFGEKVAIDDTLAGALSKVLGAVPENNGGNGKPQPDGKPSADPVAELAAALAAAQDAYNDGQQALRNGDFAAYGAAQKRLEAALERARAASARIAARQGSDAGASPSPSASAAPPSPSEPATPAPSDSVAISSAEDAG